MDAGCLWMQMKQITCSSKGERTEQWWSLPCSLLVVPAFVQCMLHHQLKAKLLKDAEKGQHEAEAMFWICVFVLGGCRTVLEFPLQLAYSCGDQADKLQCFYLQMHLQRVSNSCLKPCRSGHCMMSQL